MLASRAVSERNQAIVVCGNAGVGKSTYGAKLAAELGAALVDIDTCTERLARVVLESNGLDPEDRDSSDFKRLLREPIYETMFDVARENLGHVPCVIVGPFTSERRRASWPAELRARLDAPVRIVVLQCDAAERKARIIARKNPRDEGKLGDWDAYERVGRDAQPPPFEHELVDTTQR